MAWHCRLCLNPGRLRAGPYVYVPVFCATMCPRRITKTGCSVAWISLSTLPRTATISAALPGSRVGGDLGGESPRVRLLADPVRRHASRDEIDAFGLHQLQGVFGEESAVLDRIHTRLDSDPRGGVSVAVSGNLSFPLVSFGYDRRHFLQCELRHIHRVGLGQYAAAGGELEIGRAHV